MPINPKFTIATFWCAVSYIVLILLLLVRGILEIKLNYLTWNVVDVANQVLLIILLVFIADVVKHAQVNKYTLISFSLYPGMLLLTLVISWGFKLHILNPVILALGILSNLIIINLFIQGLRLKRSAVKVYCRLIAISLFVILFSRIVSPIIIAITARKYNLLTVRRIHANAAILSLALYIFIPILVILMIGKLKKVGMEELG